MKDDRYILLVEDDEVDVMTVKRALKRLKVDRPLVQAENGEEALEMLKNNKGKPFIILLDLNMPRMNGIEFLKVRKDDPSLRVIPVIVLTTSKEQQDVIGSYDLGVAGYMIKPVDFDQFVETLGAIEIYWRLSRLPE